MPPIQPSEVDHHLVDFILNQTEGFSEANEVPGIEEAQKRHDTSLLAIEVEDITWRVRARKWYGRILLTLLLAQNTTVFYLMVVAYFDGELAALGTFLGVILGVTLGETAYLVKLIVKWLFTDITYNKDKN